LFDSKGLSKEEAVSVAIFGNKDAYRKKAEGLTRRERIYPFRGIFIKEKEK
jgi:hypothetical protein